MTIQVKVPVLPESVEDATIASWHKQPGETIRRDENLVDLETDKVVLEVPAPVDGTLMEILAAEGDTVNSDQVIAIIKEGAVEAPSAEKETPAAPDKAARINQPRINRPRKLRPQQVQSRRTHPG